MLRINQIKLSPDHSKKDLDLAVYKALRLSSNDRCDYTVVKRSIDARHKPEIHYIYSVDINSVKGSHGVMKEQQIMHHAHNKNLVQAKEHLYEFPKISAEVRGEALPEEDRPVIIGFGPAGIFAALKLAQAGLRPIVYERGQCVEERHRSVDAFWNGAALNPESNVQFGEGGAGTFSDGKLNTMIKDPTGRIRETLKEFVRFGADESILYLNKPHIGTDVLSNVVKNIRKHIISLGGEVHFNTRMDQLIIENHQVNGCELTDLLTGKTFRRTCHNVCLAVGHSARDTFEMLHDNQVEMAPKAFAVGLRMEHPQEMINDYAYGKTIYDLPTADYKVTHQTGGKRGVYSFCMCPGGYVVNASSEEGRLAVNGMSYSKRDGKNANSAIIVTVTPEDFGEGVLAGMEFQRKLEKLAYEQGKGKVPVQLYGDFKKHKVTTELGEVTPSIKGEYTFADLNQVIPDYVAESIVEGVTGFAHQIKGFDREDAVLSGVESRTSSPVRILRNDELESEVRGLFPCGEGAGFAGGITSASVDGIKVAEQIALRIEKRDN